MAGIQFGRLRLERLEKCSSGVGVDSSPAAVLFLCEMTERVGRGKRERKPSKLVRSLADKFASWFLAKSTHKLSGKSLHQL